MEQTTKDVKGNCLQQLFDSAVWFDKDKVFNLTRKSVKDFPEKIKREFFKGFSRPNKVSSDLLEKLFRKFLNNKSKYNISYQVVKRSFFKAFFDPANNLLETAFFSNFKSPIGERIKDAIVLVSNQSGWSADVVNCIATVGPNFSIKYISEKDQSILDGLNDLGNSRRDFELSLIEDPVNAWRKNFVLQPYSVFFDVPSDKDLGPDKWDLIRDAIKNEDENIVASVLSGIVDKEDRDLDFLAQASVILILLGIDLNKKELVSLGIKKMEDKILDQRINDVSQTRQLTTLALGYAFLKKFNNALRTLSKLPSEEFTDQELGFAGSLALMARRNEEAAALFNLAFQLRESPMTWPLKALIDLDPALASPINSLFAEGKMPVSMHIHDGETVTNLILGRHPEWFKPIIDIKEFLNKLGQEDKKTKEEEKEKEKVIEEKVDANQKVSEGGILLKNNFAKELHQLVIYREEIINAEKELKEAHDRREWLSVQEIAAKLDNMWKVSLDEMREIASNLNLQKPISEGSPLLRLLSGERDPSLFVRSIELLNSLYSGRRKSERLELDAKKTAFLLRLKNVDLDYLSPTGELTQEEFLKYQENILPKIVRAEKIKDIEKGLYTVSAFLSSFPVESERESIIEEIMNKVGQFPNKNLTDIVCSINWDSSKAKTILDLVLAGTRKKFEKTRIEEKHISDIILPIIIRLSNLIGISPLQIIHQNSIIIESLNSCLVPLANETMKELLGSLLAGRKDFLPAKIAEYGKEYGVLDHAREFLLKWIDIDKDLTPGEKVKMLSVWLDGIVETVTNGEMLKEIKVLKRLRDALIEDNRQGEATLLVSTVWRASGDYRILEGFENVFYQVLVDLLKRGERSEAFVSVILENPKWLIEQNGGVLLFLYLCHIGDLPYLVEQVKYQFFNEFEDARKKYPVLIDEFFLKTRFSENPFQTGSELPSDSDVILGLQAIKEMDHDLLKASCYNSWLPASDYQTIFNRQIVGLKGRILQCDSTQLIELEEEINLIRPSKWIEDGDRNLKHKVRHPCYELMEKYLTEQITRLKILMNIRKKIPSKDLIFYLKSKSKPLKERILEERDHLINPFKEVVQIYNKIAETVQ